MAGLASFNSFRVSTDSNLARGLREGSDKDAGNDCPVLLPSQVSKMGDRYYIGKLRTARGEMRVTFFLKQTGGVFQVKQLRIEQAKGDL